MIEAIPGSAGWLRFNRNYGKWFLNDVLHAMARYRMIGEGDRVAVGLSGGKDSLALLWLLAYVKQLGLRRFELTALHVRVVPDQEMTMLRQVCESLGVPLEIGDLQRIGPLPEKSRCSLCARLKRGVLAGLCSQHRINVLAFGHHADDAAETLLMNILEVRRLGSFSPRVEVDGPGPVLVRPMVYLREKTIAALVKYLGIPVPAWPCPFGGGTVRNRYKQALAGLAAALDKPDLVRRMVAALENPDQRNFWSAPTPSLKRDRSVPMRETGKS
jgi:tRNA(Ile)-lysidine synthase TilS/MesJ